MEDGEWNLSEKVIPEKDSSQTPNIDFRRNFLKNTTC